MNLLRHLARAGTLLACLFALTLPAAAQSFWTNANQDAGTVTGLAQSPNSPLGGSGTTIFAATDGGGIHRSMDYGDNWYPTDLIDANARGVAVSRKAGRESVVWAVTHGLGAFRSADLGDDFGYPASPVLNAATPVIGGDGDGSDDLLSIAINNFFPNSAGDGDVYIGSDGEGVFVTDNQGATWFNITYNLPNLVIRSIVIKNGGSNPNDIIFVGTHGRGVWRKTTGAGVWTEANGGVLGNAVIHALAVEASGEVYAGTNHGLYRSNDNGATWTQIPLGGGQPWETETPVVRSLLAYFDNATEYLLAGTDGQYLYQTTTFDLVAAPYNWVQRTGLAPVNNTASGFQSSTVLALLAVDDPAGGDVEYLFAGTQDAGVHRSGDQGATFDQVSAQQLNAVIQAMVFSASKNKLYAGTYGYGVLMSDDLGAPHLNWTVVSNGLPLPVHVEALALRQAGTEYLFAGTWGQGVYRSTNGGESWLFSGLPGRLVYDLDHSAAGVLYAATDRGEVSRSVDNGLTWQEIGVANTAIIAIEFDGPSTIYAGTFGAGVYKSTDGGFTWAQTGMTSGYVYDFVIGTHPETLTPNTLFAATAAGVQFSTDGGATWSIFEANDGLAVLDVRALAFAGSQLLAGTWGDGVYLYDPSIGVKKWVRDGLPGMPVITFAINPDNGDVFVSTEGEGVFHKTFARVTANEPEAGLPTDYALGQNYPNPFNPTTRIEYALPDAGAVRLAVYNTLGQQVRVLVDGTVSAGTHQVTFDATGLPSGLYLYRLETPTRTLHQTMVLMK